MFTSKNEPTHLETLIDKLLTELENTESDSEKFAKIVDQLDKLHKMLPKKEPLMKPEMLIPVAGNLAGILAILSFEKTNVITTKALGFVLKARV